MKHVDRGSSRSRFPGVQGVHDAPVLLVDGHHEATAEPHAVAAEQAVAEEGGDGGVDGGPVATQDVPGMPRSHHHYQTGLGSDNADA